METVLLKTEMLEPYEWVQLLELALSRGEKERNSGFKKL